MLTTNLLKSAFLPGLDGERVEFYEAKQLIILLLEYKIQQFLAWYTPLVEDVSELSFIPPNPINERSLKWSSLVKTAWRLNPALATHLRYRFPNSADQIDSEIVELANNSEIKAIKCPYAASIFIKASPKGPTDSHLRLLLYWAPVHPISAIHLLSHTSKFQPWLLQYAIRSIENFPINLVFFYIPQLVQALRYDNYHYIEKYILDAAKSSQYFAHQIIWNMEANMYKDDNCEIPDSLKPTLERVVKKIITSLTGSDKEFYQREFTFFKKITDISGTLKPLVQADASKQEKKKKIDEELRKIKVDVGVYLPTNPDRTVVDIDYDSGRPLQSHAKVIV
jgi:phosphatidylinositol 4-kinase